MIEESKPTFSILNAVDRQGFFELIVACLPEEVQAAYLTSQEVIAVTCSAEAEQFISAPFWGAMTFAAFLASTTDGTVIDLIQCKAFEPSPRLLRAHKSAIPFTEYFLSVIGSQSLGRFDMQSRGNTRFGLPEVAILGVSEDHTSQAALVIRSYVQNLWTQIEVARQTDPNVRETNVPHSIDSEFAPGIYGVMDSQLRQFSIVVEWSLQSSADGNPLIVLSPTEDEKTWDNWVASYGDLFATLQDSAMRVVDFEGYDRSAQEARESLPAVLSRFSSREIAPGELYFKCSFLTGPDDGPPEFLWVQVQSLTNDSFVGVLRNKSAYDQALQPGLPITLTMAEVFDWIIEYPDGRLEGGYSR